MSKPLREVIKGSATLIKIAEKPLGIGAIIGLFAGGINSHFLGISFYPSVISGLFLGISVCLLASPGMKSELKARRLAEQTRKRMLRSKARTGSAFTAFE